MSRGKPESSIFLPEKPARGLSLGCIVALILAAGCGLVAALVGLGFFIWHLGAASSSQTSKQRVNQLDLYSATSAITGRIETGPLHNPTISVDAPTLRRIEQFIETGTGLRTASVPSPLVEQMISKERLAAQLATYPVEPKFSAAELQAMAALPTNPFAWFEPQYSVLAAAPGEQRGEYLVWCVFTDDAEFHDELRLSLIETPTGLALFDWQACAMPNSYCGQLALQNDLRRQNAAAAASILRYRAQMDLATSHLQAQRLEEANSAIRAASLFPMHPQLADYQHLELASIWLILRENSDCLSQCQQIQDFRTTPAALRIMAKANHLLGRHADALPQLELYLNVMGSIPSAFDLRAATLESLNRRDEAHAAWKALLQILPADPPALAGWARTMPPGKTDALIEHLRGLDNAGARAAAMAFRADVSNVPWAFESLAEFVAQTGADSCNAFLVAARRQRFEGEYAKSCQTLRAAHERAATKEDRDLVLAESIDCLLEANTPPEALDGAPRHGRFSLA